MILAGLDIATKTGLAILDGERLAHVEAFRPKGETDDAIFHGFREWLIPMLRSFNVEHVGIEEPLRTPMINSRGELSPKSNMGTYLRIYGLRGHAVEICKALNIPWTEFNQGTWRKGFLGNGRGDKDDAVRQCELLGWKVPNKDAAEACGVAWHLRGDLSPLGRLELSA